MFNQLFNSMKNIVLSLTIAVFMQMPMVSFAQAPANGKSQEEMPKDAKVSGVIIDGATGQPGEYAVIAIHKMRDSSLVSGSTSNEKGAFTVEELPYGKFYAEITFVGYTTRTVSNILLTPKQKIVNLGTIKIEPESTNLNEVVVTGNKPMIEYKLDKKVVDVSQNVVAAGGTLVDALQNIPSIQTDVEGNVTLRGSSNFTVLIDGKPSPLAGSEALQQIPASLVQNVEIITNPSAKYEAEGSAGIINVVMKKQKIRGMNSILNVTAGTGDKYSANLNLSYKISKFNFTVGGDFTDMKYKLTSYMHNVDTLNDNILKNQSINGDGELHRQGKGLKAGIDFDINNRSSLSLSGNLGNRTFNRSFNSTYFDSYLNTLNSLSNDVYYLNDNSSKMVRKYYNVNLDYQLKLNDKGQELSSSVYYSSGPDNEINYLTQDTTDNSWTSLNKGLLNQRTTQDGNEKDLRTKIDYALPIGEKGRLEAGYQGRYKSTKGDYTLENYNGVDWVKNDARYDKIDFTDQTQAAYTTFSNSMILFDYQLGVREEYEKRDLDQLIMNKQYKVERWDFFPSVHLSRELPWGLQVQASYSRRINRPRDWNLDPLIMYVDPQTIRMGNPGLLPEFANSFEFNLEKRLNEASFISAEGFLRQTKHLIQQISTFDADSVIKTLTFANIDHDRSVGVEFMLNLIPAKWFIFNASSSIYNYHMYGTPIASVSSSTNTWNLRVNPTFRIPTGTSVQLLYIYTAPTITAQGTRSGYYSTSVGLRQSFMKQKGSITLQIQNPIGHTRYSSTTNSRGLYSDGWFQRESKVFMLTLSFKINNYKAKPTKQQTQEEMNNGNDSELGTGGM
jgi:outer membrane receptor protein involved in Fe transport